MFGVNLRLLYNFLWLLAAATGFAEHWILRSFGLNMSQRLVVAIGFLPLLIVLALTCVFQGMALRRVFGEYKLDRNRPGATPE